MLSEFFEIAYAAISDRLCLFTGTGFSKAVTANDAPSWQSLLESICEECEDPVSLKEALFSNNSKNVLSLEEAAQVISIELLKKDKSIYKEIALRINDIDLRGDNEVISNFLSNESYRVITTNYDKLLEKLAGEEGCQSLTPGLPIPRSQARVTVYHVHGSVESPKDMVVTSEDYFKFINSESYFSRKLSTILHENTVVILGYSLIDTNLKAIINDYKRFVRDYVIGTSIFFVSRNEINQYVKDYYSYCYGIRVLDNMEIHDFFKKLNYVMPKTKECRESSLGNIKSVICGDDEFTKEFLEVESSFYEIISSFAALGISIEDPKVVSLLGRIISAKQELTRERNAWKQYEHLARWLIYLASILELSGTSIEETFLEATLYSMTTMRKKLYIGYSWHAYKSWSHGWSNIIASNRVLIKRYIEKNTKWPDAIEIVNKA